MLKYLRSIRPGSLAHIAAPRFSASEEYLVLDAVSFRNLEIVANLRSGTAAGSLFDAVDLTVTPMGRRLLKKWLSYPLLAKAEIERRLDGVEEFSQNLIGRSEVRKKLKYFADLARLNSKIALNIALPQHLLSLRDTLARIPEIRGDIGAHEGGDRRRGLRRAAAASRRGRPDRKGHRRRAGRRHQRGADHQGRLPPGTGRAARHQPQRQGDRGRHGEEREGRDRHPVAEDQVQQGLRLFHRGHQPATCSWSRSAISASRRWSTPSVS